MLRQRDGSTGVVKGRVRSRAGRSHDTEARKVKQCSKEHLKIAMGGIERAVGDVGSLGRGVGGMSCAHMPQQYWWLGDKGGPCTVGLGEVAQAPPGLDTEVAVECSAGSQRLKTLLSPTRETQIWSAVE